MAVGGVFLGIVEPAGVPLINFGIIIIGFLRVFKVGVVERGGEGLSGEVVSSFGSGDISFGVVESVHGCEITLRSWNIFI